MSRDFPDAFVWGASTAAHQVEGGNTNNDWWQWEHRPGSPATVSSGDAIDQYHRYDSDFALLAALGHTAHRLSLEWSRIEPADGEFSLAALAHYREVLRSVRRHGMSPFVTLQHFTLPWWLSARGGWSAPGAVASFARFTDVVMAHLGDEIDAVCTINEPSATSLYGYELGTFPPGLTDRAAADAVTGILLEAHVAAVEAVHRARPDTAAGICLALAHLEPAGRDRAASERLCQELDQRLVEPYLRSPTGDFIGVQYYTRWLIDPDGPEYRRPLETGQARTQMGWEIFPEGFGHVLRRVGAVGLPVYITENGIATSDDEQRETFLVDHLAQVAAVLREGVDVRGYFYWSAFDNFEWNDGYRPLFGLIGIDRDRDLERRVRPSATAFAEIIGSGRLPRS